MVDQSIQIVPPSITPQAMTQSMILRMVGDVNLLKAKQDKILELRDKVMLKGVHYGPPFKGSTKETLLEPGAKLLGNYFGLRPYYHTRTEEERWDTANPLFHYRYECHLYDIITGLLVATGIGSCNSMEAKYRWRNGQRVCPDCGEAAIFESNDKTGFYCWKKQNGCGHKFPANDTRITSQQIGKVVNDDIFSQVNTIDKQAQKRAYIAAILTGTGASYLFTQDVEDFKGHEYFGDPGRFENPDEGDDLPQTNAPMPVKKPAVPSSEPPPHDADGVITEPATRPAWATPENLDALFEILASEKHNILKSEIPSLIAAITNPDDPAQWNAAFASGKEAGLAVVSAFNTRMANSQPASPKQGKQEETPAANWESIVPKLDAACSRWFDTDMAATLMPDKVLGALGKIGWSEFKSEDAALKALKDYALKNSLPFVASAVAYRGKQKPMTLSNGQFGANMYSREAFRELGWMETVEKWNKIDTYPLPEPVVVEYELKTPEKGEPYYAVSEDGISLLSDLKF